MPKRKIKKKKTSSAAFNNLRLKNRIITAQVNQASTWLGEQLEISHKHFEKMATHVYGNVLPNNSADTVRPLTLNSSTPASIPPLHLGQSLTVHNSYNPSPSNTRTFDSQQEWLSPRYYQNKNTLSFEAIKQKIIETSSRKGESLWNNILNKYIELDVNRRRALNQDDIFNILDDYGMHLSRDEKNILYERYKVRDSYYLMNYVSLLQDICPNPMSLNLDHINSARRTSPRSYDTTGNNLYSNTSSSSYNNNNNNNTYNPYNDPSLKRDRYSDYTTLNRSVSDLNRSQSVPPSNRYSDTNRSISDYRQYNDPLNPNVNNPSIINDYRSSSPLLVPNPSSSYFPSSSLQPPPPPPPLSQSQPYLYNTNYNPSVSMYNYTNQSINEIIKKLKQLHDDNVWIGISVEGLERILNSANRPDLDGIIHLLGLPLNESEIQQIVAYYHNKLNGNPIAKRDIYSIFGDFIREGDYNKLKQTNIALQRELSSFDNQFFDEIEDLKYKYNQQLLRTQQLEDRLMTLCERNGISAASLLSNLPGSSSVNKEAEWEPSKKLEKILHLTKSGNFIPESIRKYLNSRNSSGEIGLDRLWELCKSNDPMNTQLIDIRTFKTILRSLLPPSLIIDSDIERLIIKFSIPGTTNLNYVNLCNELRVKDMYTALDSPFIHDLQSTGVGNMSSSPIRPNTNMSYVLPNTSIQPSSSSSMIMQQPPLQPQQPPYYGTNNYNQSQPLNYSGVYNDDDPINKIRDLIHLGRWRGISRTEMIDYLSKENRPTYENYDMRKMIDHFNIPLSDAGKAKAVILSFGGKIGLELREVVENFSWLNPQIDMPTAVYNNDSGMSDEEKKILNEVHKCLLAMSEINGCQFDPEKAFQKIDINNDNQISFGEFVEFLNDSGFTLYLDQMRNLFRYIDKSRNGYISRKELFDFFDNAFLKNGEKLSAGDLLRYCIHRLSIERNGNINLKQCFMRFDTNGNGKLSQREFKDALYQLGIRLSDDRIKALLDVIKHDYKGDIMIDDIINYYKGTLDKVKQQEVEILIRKKLERMRVSGNYRSVFKRFDRDNSNSIDKKEFGKMAKDVGVPLSEADIQWLFSQIDLNGNGRISYTEFESFLQKNKDFSFISPTDVIEIIMNRILEKLKKDSKFLEKMFSRSDIDNNKKLTRQEFFLMLKRNIQITQDESDKAFSKFDKNRDGSLSLSEFRQAVFDSKKKHNQMVKLLLDFKRNDRSSSGLIGRRLFVEILSKHFTKKTRTELENLAAQFTCEKDSTQVDYRQFIKYSNRFLYD